MNASNRSATWLRIAVVYFAIGVSLGVVMGATEIFTLRPVHVHINLLGWVSMTLIALIGRAYPAVFEGSIATAQFWLYQLTLPVFMLSLSAYLLGHAGAGPVLGASSTVMGLSVLLFAYLAFTRVKAVPAA